LNDEGPRILTTIKEAAGGEGPQLGVPVGTPVIAILRPVAVAMDRISPKDVELLTEWRNQHVAAFLTEFVATSERTISWLSSTVRQSSSKVLFMIDDLEGCTFGYMGLDQIDWTSGRAEADAIVRGRASPPMAMQPALLTLLAWARGSLGLSEFTVRVRSDNPAIRFYERCGFVETKRVPLRMEQLAEGRRWIEDVRVPSESQIVYMEFRTV
jgi:RimJ/RimL family protein N-acetyltransferase